MDAKKFAELLEQTDAGLDAPQTGGETDVLLAVAQGLKSLAPVPALDADTEHRIFTKMQALAPELDLNLEHAYGIDEELAAVADGLVGLAPAALSAESEERIFARVQQKMPELSSPPKRSFVPKLAPLGRIAAFSGLPVQRKADAFAAMLDRAAAGEPVAAGGQMGQLLAAASALRPLPAIEPSPSFVDWLEVRLTSPSNATARPARTATGWFSSLNTALSNTRLQGALAGAAAVLVAVATFNLGDVTPTTRTQTGPLAAAAPKLPDGGLPQPSSDLSPEPEVIAAAPDAPSAVTIPIGRGDRPSSNSPTIKEPNPPVDGNKPRPPAPPAEQAEPGVQGELAATSFNQEKQIMDFLRGPQ